MSTPPPSPARPGNTPGNPIRKQARSDGVDNRGVAIGESILPPAPPPSSRPVTRSFAAAAAAAPEANAGQNLNLTGTTPSGAPVLSAAPQGEISGTSSETNSRSPSPSGLDVLAATAAPASAPAPPSSPPPAKIKNLNPADIKALNFESSKSSTIYLFGYENTMRMAKILGSKGELDFRKLLEPIDAADQCKAVVGKFAPGTICYLCGLEITDNEGKGTSDETYNECEHIMPVVQARWYALIYTKDDGKDRKRKEQLKIEYAWSHRCCNQAKSSEMFISYPNPEGKVKIQDKVIDLTLQEICIRASKEPEKDKVKPPQLDEIAEALNTPAKIAERREIIKKEKLEPILKWINGRQKDTQRLYDLSAYVTITDPNNLPAKLKKLDKTLFMSVGELEDYTRDREYRNDIDKYIDKEEAKTDQAAQDLLDLSKQSAAKARESYRHIISAERHAILLARAQGINVASPTNSSASQSSGGSARRRKRRTRRRTDRLFPKLTKKTRRSHHSMRMSSIRHSLSGKAAKR